MPNANPDAANFSLYDLPDQAKTLANRCAAGVSNDPLARGTWGVAIERNFSAGSVFDGYLGGSTSCSSPVFSGLFELSEPETRNLAWVASTFPSIRFAVDLQSNGGYLTWSPGAYVDNGAPHAPAAPVGGGRRLHGPDRRAGRGQPRAPPRPGAPAAAHRSADRRRQLGGGQRDRPALVQPRHLRRRARRRARGACQAPPARGVTSLVDPGLAPAYAPEGGAEVMEAADGLLGLLGAARAYALDTTAPVATPRPGGRAPPRAPFAVTFTTSEPADRPLHGRRLDAHPRLADLVGPGPAARRGRPRSPSRPRAPSAGSPSTSRATSRPSSPRATSSTRHRTVTTQPQVNGTGCRRLLPRPRPSPRPPADEPGRQRGVAATEHRLDGGPFTPYTAPCAARRRTARTVLEFRSRDVAGNEEPIRSVDGRGRRDRARRST